MEKSRASSRRMDTPLPPSAGVEVATLVLGLLLLVGTALAVGVAALRSSTQPSAGHQSRQHQA